MSSMSVLCRALLLLCEAKIVFIMSLLRYSNGQQFNYPVKDYVIWKFPSIHHISVAFSTVLSLSLPLLSHLSTLIVESIDFC